MQRACRGSVFTLINSSTIANDKVSFSLGRFTASPTSRRRGDHHANRDVRYLPGGPRHPVRTRRNLGDHRRHGDPATLAFMTDRGARAKWVTSMGTGLLILGKAGLLRGYRATSH